MKKFFQVANFLALIITIGINYLSNTGFFYGNTMKTISDKYHNYFTPAGYAFSIWGLIYLGLLGFVIYTGKSLFKKEEDAPEEVSKIGSWFIVTCVCNSVWVILWLGEQLALSVIVMLILLIALVKIIFNLRMELDYHPFKKYLFIFWPFALYAGWISVALIADVAAWLTKINWEGWGISQAEWTIIMIAIAALINVLVILKRNLREYGLAGIWALIAIAVANSDSISNIRNACYAASIIIFLSIVLSGIKGRKGKSINKM